MAGQVKVEDLQVFSQFRAAMLKFAQAADSSLANADSHISRTRMWLENEQATFWVAQLRKREEAVTKARDAVRAKKMYKDVGGQTKSAIEEEKFLAKCVSAVQEAQQKIENVRRWMPRLEKASDMYRSGVARLNKTIMDDIPRGVALLDRLAMSVEQYMQIETPAGVAGEATEFAVGEASMSRGSDVLPEAPAPTAPAAPVAAEPAKKEDGRVGPGQ